MPELELEGFSHAEVAMIEVSLAAMKEVGYDIGLIRILIRADMPTGFRGMSLDDGAVLGAEAFESQELLNHVLEEEYLHLLQKRQGLADRFDATTALELERAVHGQRRFPAPS